MATIPGVSDNELIRTSWGDAVADELNGNTVKKTAAQTMAGPLTVTGAVTASSTVSVASSLFAGGQVAITPAAPTAVGHATRKDYVDAQIATRLADNGGTITGLLIVNPAGAVNTCVRLAAPTPTMEWYNDAASTRYAYINAASDRMQIINSTATLMFFNDDAEMMRLLGAALLIGKTASGNTEGIEHRIDGQILSTVAVSGARNVNCGHIGDMDADNAQFIRFTRTSAGTQIGRIEQNGTSGVTYVTSSDYRAKTVVGPIGDAVERVKALRPYRVTWNDDPGRGETDAFLAHEVAPIVPEAVSGEKDAVAGPPVNDDDPPAGTPVMQGMDYSKLMAVTVAALQDALAQIETLQARVDALESAA